VGYQAVHFQSDWLHLALKVVAVAAAVIQDFDPVAMPSLRRSRQFSKV